MEASVHSCVRSISARVLTFDRSSSSSSESPSWQLQNWRLDPAQTKTDGLKNQLWRFRAKFRKHCLFVCLSQVPVVLRGGFDRSSSSSSESPSWQLQNWRLDPAQTKTDGLKNQLWRFRAKFWQHCLFVCLNRVLVVLRGGFDRSSYSFSESRSWQLQNWRLDSAQTKTDGFI